eukprot:jgi/Bigna1/82557/fgenesh1_pg.94_\
MEQGPAPGENGALDRARTYVLKRQLSLTSSLPILLHASAESGDLKSLEKHLEERDTLLMKSLGSAMDALEQHRLELKELVESNKNALGKESSVKAFSTKMRLIAQELDDLYKSRIPALSEVTNGKDKLNVLERAAFHGNLEICRHLVEKCEMGVVVRTNVVRPRCPSLIWAIKGKHLKVIQYLVKKNASMCLDHRYESPYTPCQKPENNGNTALHFAAEASPKITGFLLERKANINVRNEKGLTPLLHAMEGDHGETFKAFAITSLPPSSPPLLQNYFLTRATFAKVIARADLTAAFQETLFPLVESRKVRCLRALLEEGGLGEWRKLAVEKRKKCVRSLMGRQDCEMLQILFKTGILELAAKKYIPAASTNASTISNQRPECLTEDSVLLAALGALPRTISQLMQDNTRKFIKMVAHPSNVNVKSAKGETPLGVSLRVIRESKSFLCDIVKDLIAVKADVDVREGDEHKEHLPIASAQVHLIFKAVRKRYLPLLNIILLRTREGHCINNWRDEDGYTVCAAAIRYGSREIVQCLVGANADVNLQSDSGLRPTPLMIAVNNSGLPPLRVMQLVEFLMKSSGADCLVKDVRGYAAADYVKDVVRSIRSTERTIIFNTPNSNNMMAARVIVALSPLHSYKRALSAGRKDAENLAYTAIYKFLRKIEKRRQRRSFLFS